MTPLNDRLDSGLAGLPKVCAVSYLNTVPLVWGMLHGPQREDCRLSFCLPSECADRVHQGLDDLGIVPVIEVQRQGLLTVPGAGIACTGPVRSILLVSNRPPARIRTLAADIGSRTSVALAQWLLRTRFDANPAIVSMAPSLPEMLRRSDAALLIGDAALRLQPDQLPYHVIDLGQLWVETTCLPMVFAVWAGKPHIVEPLLAKGMEDTLMRSLTFGINNMNTIVETESRSRGFSPDLIRHYLTHHISFLIGEPERKGLELFLHHAEAMEGLLPSGKTI